MQQRFENFKIFVESEAPSDSMIPLLLKPMTLQMFIAGIVQMKIKYDDGQPWTGQRASKLILSTLGLHPLQFTPPALDKFQRYCEYFLEQTA